MFGMGMGRMGRVGGGLKTLAQLVAGLFKNGEQGFWLDPSDFSTMYQDAAGTIPVTAIEQPVGLILDKRLGLVRGPELVVDQYPDNPGSWFVGANTSVSVVASQTRFVAGGVAIATINNWFGIKGAATAGSVYEISFDATWVSGGNLSVGSGYTQWPFFTPAQNQGVKQRYILTIRTQYAILEGRACFSGEAGAVWDIDNVSCREIPGNHFAQPTSTARPLLKFDGTNYYLQFDGVDDSLATTFGAALGGSCTVARSVPSTGAQILTGQTIGTTFTETTTSCGVIVIDRALTAPETATVTAYLNGKAGV